jgi:hypothetical protein
MASSTLPLFPTDEGWPYPDLADERFEVDPVADGEPDLDDLDLRIDPHAFAKLDDRERRALFAHFGLDGGEAVAMKGLALRMGCSRREARDLVGSAIDKVRRHLTATA